MSAPERRLPRKVTHLLACVLFAILLVAPSLDTFFHISPDVNLMEAAPQPQPEFSFRTIFKYFNGLQRGYLEKTFGFRKLLVRLQNALDIFGLYSSSQYGPVVAGKDDWLFLSQENNELNVVEEYRSVDLFTPKQLAAWTEVFVNRRDWLASRGIAYFVVVAPNKHTIYPEKLPDPFSRVRPVSRMDQLVGSLEQRGVEVVDLRQALFESKKRDLAYYRTDNHWTVHGAFAAYKVIMERLAKVFPVFSGAVRTENEVEVKPGLLGGLGFMLALGDKYPEDKISYLPKIPRTARKTAPASTNPSYFQPPEIFETDDPSLPKAIVFRDSFAHELIPFLSEHFSRVVYLWPYPSTLRQIRLFDRSVIEKEKPQLVIEEFVERYFTMSPPRDPEPSKP